jgi:hypothetical protein
MVIPNIDDIYRWYKINGCPTRQDVREGKVNLPEGASKSLIESLIPYFNSKLEEKTLYIPTDENKEEVSMVITSDWHIPFHDKEVLKTFINFLYEYQPDELVLNGNINDCTAFSTHPKLRDVATAFRTAREEREYWFPIAELLRDVLPDSKITYIGSQCHEGWIDKWTALSPILLEDENYTIKNWFKLDDFGIEFVPEVYDPVGDSTFLISHGTIARGKSGASAMASLEMEGTSTCIAHTHKLSQVFKTNAVGEIVGLECGCMCLRTPWYHLKGRRLMMDWQQGFVLANFKGNSFSTSCIPIIRDSQDKPYFWIGKELYK